VDLDNRLRGQLVAAAFEVLLLDAGYHVGPTGIERSLRELRTVAVDRYLELAPPQLRTTPDFFVLDLKGRKSWLAEVKFRRYLHKRLLNDLATIRETWAAFVLVLVLAEPPDEWTGEVRHIRAFRIVADTALTWEFLLKDGRRLQDVFVHLKDRWADGTILAVQESVLRLAGNHEKDENGAQGGTRGLNRSSLPR
jgi:hypothetical protein